MGEWREGFGEGHTDLMGTLPPEISQQSQTQHFNQVMTLVLMVKGWNLPAELGSGCPVRPQHLHTDLPVPHATFKAFFTCPQSPTARHGTRCSPCIFSMQEVPGSAPGPGTGFYSKPHFPGTDKPQG